MDLTTKSCEKSEVLDRISSLPKDLLIQILSLLTTKDAVATTSLSRSLRSVQPWITNLDFDDSPISHCLDRPCRTESFPAFKTFVDNILKSSLCQHLDDVFRLRFGVTDSRISQEPVHECSRSDWENEKDCFPDVNPTDVDAWICFPVTRSIKELDLCFRVREPGKLPPGLFNCETLEVMKLNINLEADQVSSTKCIHLPNLKVLHLSSITIPQTDFVTKLVLSCPSLEELVVDKCDWKDAHVIISSHSLRILQLHFDRVGEVENSDTLVIDTPNLQEFSLRDSIAHHYSINANSLVKATINIEDGLIWEDPITLSLLRALSNVNVQCLTLLGLMIEDDGELKDQMPVFHNLKQLLIFDGLDIRWDKVLLEFLNSSPVLEEIQFPTGIDPEPTTILLGIELERQGWEANQAIIPPCCTSHLKRIVIEGFYGVERELQLVKFLLNKALVLEELLIFICRMDIAKAPNRVCLERTLNELPRASKTCSIIVH